MPTTVRQIWLCGQKYDRCTSEFGGLLCAHELGHDGSHHSNWQYWTTMEADAAAARVYIDDRRNRRLQSPPVPRASAPDCGRPQHYTEEGRMTVEITNTYSFCQHCTATIFQQLPDPAWYLANVPAASTGCADSPTGHHQPARHPTEDDYQAIVWRQPIIGDSRSCPDCGRLQHYTGTEAGWAHDELIATWDCNDPGLYGSGNHPAGDQYGPADMTMYDRDSR